MDWSIRRFEADEAALVVPLLRQVQEIHAAAPPDTFRSGASPDELVPALRERLGRDGMIGLAAMAPDGSALGPAAFGAEVVQPTPLRHGQRFGLLHHVPVDRERRRSGIGAALVKGVRAHLRSQGVASLRTTYWTFDEVSAALMRKAGLVRSEGRAEAPVEATLAGGGIVAAAGWPCKRPQRHLRMP